MFQPSIDHDTNVDGYVFEVMVTGSAPRTVAQQSLGKPPVVGGEISVDVSAVLRTLPAGSYIGLVKAVNVYGSSPGAASAAFTIQ